MLTKSYLCETTSVLVCFSEKQLSEFNKILIENKKCLLYLNRSQTEVIFICEGCNKDIKERQFGENFIFEELRKCLIKRLKKKKKNQPIFLPEILGRII